jgi:hypothetical protein
VSIKNEIDSSYYQIDHADFENQHHFALSWLQVPFLSYHMPSNGRMAHSITKKTLGHEIEKNGFNFRN